MSIFKSKESIVETKVKKLNETLESHNLSDSIETNTIAIKKLFENDDTLITRSIVNNFDDNFKYCIVYCDGMVDPLIINENIIKPLMLSNVNISQKTILDSLINQVILINDIKKISTIKEIIEEITYGNTVLFIENSNRALSLNTKGFQTRGIEEPSSEKILSGPREGFSESLLINLSLIRRKLRTNELKMKYVNFGKKSNTQACVCYIDSIVNKKVLTELYRRLDKIDIDGVLDSNYIVELIKDAPFSMFRTTGGSERPDTIVGKLLEGRIAVVVDGTPVVITLPYLFIENFQNSEDYYLSHYYATFSRFLRFLGFVLTVFIPAFYIAIVAFHHEMLPTSLFINIAMERQSVPLPAAVEAFVLLIMFDILKETGVRMPSNIGQALSIVGALVIGQAAVEAKLVAAPMIIVVASTGITSLLIPKVNTPVIFLRIAFLILASFLGFYGLVLGIAVLIIHLVNLRSFGIPQIMASGDVSYQNIKDKAIRAPWWDMILRPKLVTNNRKRMNSGDNNND